MYTKLLQFQDRLLESYQGPQIDYSSSDYHHVAVDQYRPTTSASMPPGLGQQQGSRYSLLQPGVYHPKTRSNSAQTHKRHLSAAKTEATEESYDPFRPSRTRIAPTTQGGQATVTVLRNGSRLSSRKSSSRIPSRSIRSPTIERLQEDDALSIRTSPPNLKNAGHDRFERMASNQRRMSRGNSRTTVLSNRSVNSATSSVVVHKPAGKRNVTFPHQLRRISGPRRLRSDGDDKTPFTLYQRYLQDQLDERRERQSVVILHNATEAASTRKPAPNEQVPLQPRSSPRKLPKVDQPRRSASQYVANDARQLSRDLAKLCDETWNRESVASTTATASTPFRHSRQSYETRATSISAHDLGKFSLPSSRDGRAGDGEVPPPPPPSSEKPKGPKDLPIGTRREIERTREVLRQRARDSCIPPGALDQLIDHLDRLMQPSNVRLAEEQRRAASTPDPVTGIPRKDTFDQILEDNNVGHRATSEPMKVTERKLRSTIRLVDEEEQYRSLQTIEPLTIRKKSGSSGPSSGSRTPTQQEFPLYDQRPAGFAYIDEHGLDAIHESSDKENFDPIVRDVPKKRNWFRRHHAPQRSRQIEIGPPIPLQESRALSDPLMVPSNPVKASKHTKSRSESRPPLSNKKSFLNLFKGKKDRSYINSATQEPDYDIDDSASQMTNESTTSVVHHHHRKHSQSHPNHLLHAHPATNWLTRFFRLKPSTHVLVFHISKPRARREIHATFLGWRKYGMADITLTKSPVTTIRARVDAENSLRIPSCKLVCEVHEVLFRGRKAGMSVARLVQEKGARGSFERVVGALEEMMGERGLLVEDEGVKGEVRSGVGF